jgi:hypothetical protein
MSIKVCPNCGEDIIVGFDCSDFNHKCNSGNDALDKEDIPIIGTYEDENGTTNVSKYDVMKRGLKQEKLFINDEFNVRGNRKATHIERQKYTYIENLEGKNDY